MADEKRLKCPNGHALFGHVPGGSCGVCGAVYGQTKTAAEYPPIVLETKEHGATIAYDDGSTGDPFTAHWSQRA